ncbi:MAG: hypothetical protein CMF39_05820 [Legionellaceae bacterium]|nr:hypothetical protein [Legionellaceae bacterium]
MKKVLTVIIAVSAIAGANSAMSVDFLADAAQNQPAQPYHPRHMGDPHRYHNPVAPMNLPAPSVNGVSTTSSGSSSAPYRIYRNNGLLHYPSLNRERTHSAPNEALITGLPPNPSTINRHPQEPANARGGYQRGLTGIQEANLHSGSGGATAGRPHFRTRSSSSSNIVREDDWIIEDSQPVVSFS